MATYKLVTDNKNTFFTNNKITLGTAAPTSGTHAAGDIVLSSSANSTAFGWICTAAGTPGTWKVLKSGGDVTSVSGNAGTATKFASAQSVTLTGDVTGTASSQAGWSVATTLANSGVTAGSYGPSANVSPAHSGTFSVPYITVDAKGRVTSASTKTITLPADNNTDTKVTNTLATTTKAYITGTTSSSTNTGTQVFDTGVYLDTTAGQLTATTFKGDLSGNAATATVASQVKVFSDATSDQKVYVLGAVENTLDSATIRATSIYMSSGTLTTENIKTTGTIISGSTVRSDTAVTDNLGTAAIPWSSVYADHFQIYGEASKQYGFIGAVTTGTTSTNGESRLSLGNATASGTASNSYGRIQLYGTSSGYTWLTPGNNSTSNITLTLPSSGGTLARTADLSKYLPLAGGTMTGNITMTNGTFIRSKTPADYTNTSTSASVASGTEVNILTYNSSGNCHVNSGAYDNYLSTGSLYLNSPNNIYIRTQNDGGHYVQINGSSVAYFTIDEAAFTKNVYAKAGIKSGGNILSDTALTDNLGTSAIPWKNAYSKQFTVGGEASKTYGYVSAYTIGTTDTAGECRMVLGNSTASGTASNASGKIFMYGTSSAGTFLAPSNNSTTSNTVYLPSGGGYLPLLSKGDTNYWGLLLSDGSDSGWIRTTSSGLIPYDNTGENSTLGTSSWQFKAIYGKSIYEGGTALSSKYLPLAGGTMTGDITFKNNVGVMGTIKTATTDSSGTAVAAGTTIDIIHLNSSDNLHVGGGIFDNSITTGGTYVSGGASATVRTVAGPVNIKPNNTAVASFESDAISFSKPITTGSSFYSGGIIRPTSAVTYNCGSSSYPWLSTCSKNFYSYDSSLKNGGSLRTYTEGTADTQGEYRLYLGNGTASGTLGNYRGRIYMYGTNTGYTCVTPGNNTTSNYTLTLPAKTGTLACTSDLSSYLPLSGGTLTGSLGFSYSGENKATISVDSYGLNISASGIEIGGCLQADITSSLLTCNNLQAAGTITCEGTFNGPNQSAIAGGTTTYCNGTNYVCDYIRLQDKLLAAPTNSKSEYFYTLKSDGSLCSLQTGTVVTDGISLRNGTTPVAFAFVDTTGWFAPNSKGIHIGDENYGLYFCGTDIGFCNFSGDTSISSVSSEDGEETETHANYEYCKIYHQGFKPTADEVGALSTEGGTVTGETTFESVVTADTIYSTNAINISSDRNLKNDVRYINKQMTLNETEDDEVTLKDMYDFVKDELGLATYTMKNDKESKKKVNFIAQDLLYNNNNEDSKVGQLIVNAEHAVNNDTTLSYDLGNYNSIMAGALQYAIQLFSSKIEESDNKIAELEARIKELESK